MQTRMPCSQAFLEHTGIHAPTHPHTHTSTPTHTHTSTHIHTHPHPHTPPHTWLLGADGSGVAHGGDSSESRAGNQRPVWRSRQRAITARTGNPVSLRGNAVCLQLRGNGSLHLSPHWICPGVEQGLLPGVNWLTPSPSRFEWCKAGGEQNALPLFQLLVHCCLPGCTFSLQPPPSPLRFCVDRWLAARTALSSPHFCLSSLRPLSFSTSSFSHS